MSSINIIRIIKNGKMGKSKVPSDSILNPISILIIITCILLITSSVSAQLLSEQLFAPPDQPEEPTVTLELDEVKKTIDTSADIAEPVAQVTGTVIVKSQTPIYLNVNLTIESNWNSTVAPNNFTVSIISLTGGEKSEVITVEVKAPLGIENGTEETVTVSGKWSYIEGLPGGGIIDYVDLKLTAQNTSKNSQDGDGNGDDKDKDDEPGFLPGFEGIIVVICTLFVIILIVPDRKSKT